MNPTRLGPTLIAGALAAVLLAALAAAGSGHWLAPAPAAAESPALGVRALRFVDLADGGIDVIDARLNRRVAAIEPGRDGFVRSTMRGLARERRRLGLNDEQPFELRQEGNGRLVLHDPASGRRIELQAFGATNAGAFARLFHSEETPR